MFKCSILGYSKINYGMTIPYAIIDIVYWKTNIMGNSYMLQKEKYRMVLWYNTKEYEVTNIIHICNLKVLMWKDLHKILVPLSSGYPMFIQMFFSFSICINKYCYSENLQ